MKMKRKRSKSDRKKKPARPRKSALRGSRGTPSVRELKSTMETGTSHGGDPIRGTMRQQPYESWGKPKD